MKQYFKLLGWQSMVLILVAMLMLRSQLFVPFHGANFLPMIVDVPDYLAFCFGLMLMMASFNVICSYFDDKMQNILDKVQKESLETKNKLKMFWLLAALGLAFEVYVGIMHRVWQIAAFALVFECGAYFYALKYKREYLIGNIIVSLLFALIMFMPMFLELFTIKAYKNPIPIVMQKEAMMDLINVFLFLSGSVFVLTFVRDLTVDLANIDLNKKQDIATFPAIEGENKTKHLLCFASVLMIALTLWFSYSFIDLLDRIHIIFTMVLVVIPMIYYIVKLYRGKLKTDYATLYHWLGMIYISLLLVIWFCADIYQINVIN